VSWRSGFLLGAAALAAISVAGVAGGTAQIAAASAAASAAAPASVTGVRAGSATGVTYQVGGAAQRGALAYWTPRRMGVAAASALPLSATGLRAIAPRLGAALFHAEAVRGPGANPGPVLAESTEETRARATSQVSAPKGIPRAAAFSGSPTTGALFYTTGGKARFCSASVVNSTAGDLVLTAAHCVDGKGLAANVAYVPWYHEGKRPYGAWAVRAITVAVGWQRSHDPDLDFAFLVVGPAAGRKIQARTGGLTIGFTRWYNERIEVIGDNTAAAAPVRCVTKSFRFRPGQMEFYCHGFWAGTSGGPWIIGYNAKTGGGTVFGVIGGYQAGGDYEWASYSAYFGSAARTLYQQADRQLPAGRPPADAPAQADYDLIADGIPVADGIPLSVSVPVVPVPGAFPRTLNDNHAAAVNHEISHDRLPDLRPRPQLARPQRGPIAQSALIEAPRPLTIPGPARPCPTPCGPPDGALSPCGRRVTRRRRARSPRSDRR